MQGRNRPCILTAKRAGYSRLSYSDTVVATPQQPFYQLDLRVLGVSSLHVYSNTKCLTSNMRPSFTVQLKFNVVHVRLASKTSVYQELLIAIECSAIISTILIRRVQI